MLGLAYANAQQTGVKMHQGVREKIAQLACYREGIAAHLTASIEMAEESPGGLLMPNQALLYTGRVHACAQLPEMMHLVRDLCGCQISLVPSAATFRCGRAPGNGCRSTSGSATSTPRTGARCSPTPMTCSTPTTRATG